MKKLFFSLLCTVMILCMTSCAGNKSDSGSKPVIAVSILPQAAFAQAVCGEDFEIITAIPAGASPETYEPTPAVMQKLSDAELYFSIGVRCEETSILPVISNKTTVVPLHEKVSLIYPELTIAEERDPHIWLSLKRVKVMVSQIAAYVSEIRPEKSEEYNANAEAYNKQLDELDEKIRDMLKNCNGSKFITFHPAFGYLADEYSLEMYSLEEDGKEATPKQLAQMTDFAKKENIDVIFYQSENSSKQAMAFAEEINGSAVMLEPLSFDYISNYENMAKAVLEAVR